jgi:hypothetical protein
MRKCLYIVLAVLLIASNSTRPFARAQSTPKQWAYITEGVGIAGVVLGKSNTSDIVSAFGNKYTVHTHNEYSRDMEYTDLGLSFYYCFKDKEKTIFLVEVHHGTTSKGIIIGRSTLRDVYDLYGERDETSNCETGSCVCEYPGVQFYVEGPNLVGSDKALDPTLMKVVEIDVVPPDKSSNFCDGI